MCHISRNINSLDITVQTNTSVTGLPVSQCSMGNCNSRQQSKMTFRLSPFRRVAKSARINLNRYWGILSQSSAMKPAPLPASCQSIDHSEEIEQNRINELLEAQAAAAVNDNDRNTEYENSPDFNSTGRRFCFSSSSSYTSSVSSDFIPFDDDELMDTMSQDSIIL